MEGTAHAARRPLRHVSVLLALAVAAAWLALVVTTLLAPPPQAGGGPRSTGERVDPNHAPRHELQLLPGIGPARAADIIEHRRTHGPFHRVEDLEAVRGIGPKTLERLRPFVQVTPPASSPSPAPSLHEGPSLRRPPSSRGEGAWLGEK